MSDPSKQSIYRPRAVSFHMNRSEKAVFPMVISARARLLVWAAIAIAFGALALTWLTRVPSYAVGLVASATRDAGDGASHAGGREITLLLPAAALPHLRAGQRVIIRPPGEGPAVFARLSSVYPDVVGAEALRERLAQTPCILPRVSGDVALATVSADEFPPQLAASIFAGAAYEARVEVGSYRVFSLLRGLGRRGGGDLAEPDLHL